MYVSIRTYRVGAGSIADLTHRVDRDLAEAFAQEPGFLAYQVARTGEHTLASMTVFRDRDQAEASNDLAAEWVADNLAEFEVERMGVMGGEVLVSRANAEMLVPAHA
jgi:quinol monooxygenase YgiN